MVHRRLLLWSLFGMLSAGAGTLLLWRSVSQYYASLSDPAEQFARVPDDEQKGAVVQPEQGTSSEGKPWQDRPDVDVRLKRPLPSASISFAEQYSELLDAHRSGDTVASCRLALGVTECMQHQRSMEFTRAMERNVRMRIEQGSEDAADQALITATATSLEFLESRAASCGGGVVAAGPSASEIIEFAAPRLTASQKTILAMLRADGQLRRLNPANRSYQQSQQYVYPQYLADRALEFLESGFRAGHPLALEGLAVVHAPGMGIPFQGVGPSLPNPRLYARYALLLEELYGPEVLGAFAQQLIELSLASLPPNEVQQVHQWVASERSRWQSLGASATDKSALTAWSKRSVEGDVDALCSR